MSEARSSGRHPGVGVVVIGRNEGERLRRCLESVRGAAQAIVYVDSGSTDGSVALATGLGATVVALDMRRPFTAARARNEGMRRLQAIAPDLVFVQFVDGDCEMVAGWLPLARAASSKPSRRSPPSAAGAASAFRSDRSTTCCATWNGTRRSAKPGPAAAT